MPVIKALNPFAPEWFTPAGQSDVPEDKQVQFQIRGLDGVEISHISPECIFDESGTMIAKITGRGSDLVLGFGLLGWRNFSNESDIAIEFGKPQFGLIPFPVLNQIVMAILAASSPRKEQKKNS